MNLSKSRYTQGVQCPKMLWMSRHMPEEFDQSVLNQAVLENGSMVGDLAMGYYGEFVEVPFDSENMNTMVEQTQILLEKALSGEGPANICEASFALDGNFCSVDILRVWPDGVDIVEVKSSTHVAEIYYHDMAYQTWLLQRCGLRVKSVSLMHVNSRYVRQGEVDLHQLFVPVDCTETVFAMLPEVELRVPVLKAVAEQAEEPSIAFGCHCAKPYPCGYRSWCWREVPVPSVFDLARLGTEKALEHYKNGVVTLQDVLNSGMKLTARQRVQVQAEVEQRDTIVDKKAVAKFLQGLSYPLYFLDFETFQPAVPLFDGSCPYQQIPSQYSLHVLDAPDAPLRHLEFLAEAGTDPRRAVAERLSQDIPASACTLAYNMSFEKGRIEEMAKAFPDLADRLRGIAQSMVDLIVPFRSGAYYARAMGGSNSIKAVLPALFPGDPQLDYHQLDGVHNGSEAMAAFAQLEGLEANEAAEVRKQLLQYCELDTLAMVKLWQRLREAAE